MRTGELAAQAGVNIQTVRLYERLGLLRAPMRLRSGYRDYGITELNLMRVIKEAQRLGFTLKEIKALIQLRDRGSYTRDEMRAVARAKLAQLEERITRLEAMRDAIRHGLSNCSCSDEFPMCLFSKSAGLVRVTPVKSGKGVVK